MALELMAVQGLLGGSRFPYKPFKTKKGTLFIPRLLLGLAHSSGLETMLIAHGQADLDDVLIEELEMLEAIRWLFRVWGLGFRV